MTDFEYFRVLSVCLFFMKKRKKKSVLNMASSHSQIDKLQHGHSNRAELLDVNINTGVQSINTERASLNEVKMYCMQGVQRLGCDR